MSIAFRVRSFDEVPSTNEAVKRALDEGEAEGFAVRARRQTAGYGRQGRRWTSPEGGLYCSLLLRPQVAAAELPTLSLVAGMAVRRALAGLVSSLAPAELAEPHVPAGLVSEAGSARILVKWPNDVVLAEEAVRPRDAPGCAEAVPPAKLCGISLEGRGGGVCVGVGVNVRPPAERPEVGGKNRAAYVADVVDASVDDVLDAFLAAFAPLYGAWTSKGFAPLADEFNAHSSLAGRTVAVVDREGATLASGLVVRVDGRGRLVLRDASGAEAAVSSGEAHLATLA